MTEMTPADVPDELVEACGAALLHAPWLHDGGGAQIRAVLAAALPLHEQRIRERIASELYGLPIAQHLGIPHSNATQHAVDVAEAAQRWMITVIQRPDLVPESVRGEAHLSARVRENSAWPADLPKLRGCDCPTGGGND